MRLGDDDEQLRAWKPWMLSALLVEKPSANRCSSMRYAFVSILPLSTSAAAAYASRISRQTISSTCRCVGPRVSALLSGRVSSHHSTARPAAQSLPEPFAPTTLTRRWSTSASSISACFEYGVPAPPSTSVTNPTGSFAYRVRSSVTATTPLSPG
ncbi:MAG: hypothetical protein F4045_10545 [Chloroflexi bacterium]|nr:hypothetical protein [Chloroflexota bacterium]